MPVVYMLNANHNLFYSNGLNHKKAMDCKKFSTYMVLLLSISVSSAQNPERPIGANLTDLSPFGTVWIYTNSLKQSSGWLIENANDTDDPINFSSELTATLPIPMDAFGYPEMIPFSIEGHEEVEGKSLQLSCLVLNGQPSPWYYPEGEYLLVFEGEGEIQITGDVDNEFMRFDSEGEHIVPISNPTELGLIVTIVRSSADRPIQNIELIFPEYVENYQTNQFRADFIALVQAFDVLRFMKPSRAEYNNIEHWDDRATPDHFSFFFDQEDAILAGMPDEDIIALCNLAGIDPWISIPHMATNEYITALAELYNRELDETRQVYVEYSNEAWNPSYPSKYEWMLEQGNLHALATSEIPEVAEAEAIHRFYVKRMFEVFEIFRSVFENDNQFVKVHGTQSDPFVANLVLEAYDITSVNPNDDLPDAIAPASYIGVYLFNDLAEQNLNVCDHSASELLDTLRARIDWEMAEALTRFSEITNDLEIDLYAYEGGQHVTEINFQPMEPCAENLIAQMHDLPEMEDFICELMDSWYEDYDGELFMFFNLAEKPDAYGSFGLLQTQWQSTVESPKWEGLERCVFQTETPLSTTLDQKVFTIYPNPNSLRMLNISLRDPGSHLVIQDFTGRMVYQYSLLSGDSEHDLSHLTNGVYTVKVFSENRKMTQKLILR